MTGQSCFNGQNYIDGQWRDGAVPFETLNPSDLDEVVGRYSKASPDEVSEAMDAARRALPAWAAWNMQARADLLNKVGELILARKDEIGLLLSREEGKTLPEATGEAIRAAQCFQYAAGDIVRAQGQWFNSMRDGHNALVTREPVGVVAAITPWNYPQALAAMKIGPALAAGCTVVLKPAPETALDAYAFADAALDAGLPAGVINVVPADRDESAYLVAHPGIDKVAFTGSTGAGRAIGQMCGGLLRPVTLELGGKSASIVLPDADLDTFVRALPEVSLANNGQTCHASTRILAPRARWHEVVSAVTDTVAALSIGDPLDRTTAIGPLVSAAQRDRVLGFIESGRSEGFPITTGGGTPQAQAQGWFVEPTVFADVDNSARIAQEEIFGPVLTITGYDDEDEAVRIANDSPYGLGGTIWTADEEHGLAVAARIETGTIGVNHYALDFASPFGGVKASGLGRELGPEGLAPYLTAKSVYFATS